MSETLVTLDQLNKSLETAKEELSKQEKLLSQRAKAKQKEYQEYANLERSKSAKFFAKLTGGTKDLKARKAKEEEEYLEASRQEAQERDKTHSLQDRVNSLQSMIEDLNKNPDKIDDITARFNQLDTVGSKVVPTGSSRNGSAAAVPTTAPLQPKKLARPHKEPSDQLKIEPFTLPPVDKTSSPSPSSALRAHSSLRVHRVEEPVTPLRPSKSVHVRKTSEMDEEEEVFPLYDMQGNLVPMPRKPPTEQLPTHKEGQGNTEKPTPPIPMEPNPFESNTQGLLYRPPPSPGVAPRPPPGPGLNLRPPPSPTHVNPYGPPSPSLPPWQASQSSYPGGPPAGSPPPPLSPKRSPLLQPSHNGNDGRISPIPGRGPSPRPSPPSPSHSPANGGYYSSSPPPGPPGLSSYPSAPSFPSANSYYQPPQPSGAGGPAFPMPSFGPGFAPHHPMMAGFQHEDEARDGPVNMPAPSMPAPSMLSSPPMWDHPPSSYQGHS